MEDDSGISTSSKAVDHDMVVILDNDQSNPVVLCDQHQTDVCNYKKVQVNYSLRDLSPGLHLITLNVWDVYNNLSETTLSFFVVYDRDIGMNKSGEN